MLEQDIAITNISLDLIGQARNFYQHAAALKNDGSTEDSLAYLRDVGDFKNCLLVEQPNGDWAQTILRQFFFSAYQDLLYKKLLNSDDKQIAAIAEKSLKEISYHLRWSSEWVIRLGDGTDESRQRINAAINSVWDYTGELFIPASYETGSQHDPSILRQDWESKVKEIFAEATLSVPERSLQHKGGKEGAHSEYLESILSDLQFMQRAYPGCEW